MPLSHAALDMFVSQELSKLTACRPRGLSSDFPDRQTWLEQFILRRIFQNHVAEDRAALAFAIVRRAEAAVDEWELACEVANGNVQQASRYFKTLRHIENCIAAAWQGLDLGRRALKSDLFAKGDDSVFERLNWLYNKGRHFDPQALPSGALHALWLSNEAVHSHEHAVTFDELRDAVSILGRLAKQIAEGVAAG